MTLFGNKFRKDFYKPVKISSIVVLTFFGVYFTIGFVTPRMLTSSEAIAAFFGAFFTFLFLIVATVLNHSVERRRLHHNTLIRLEFLLNDFIASGHYNLSQLSGLTESITQTKKGPLIKIQYIQFKSYKIERELLSGLRHLGLLNDVFSGFVDLDYLNDSQSSLLAMYVDMRSRYLDDIHNTQDIGQRNIISEKYKSKLYTLDMPIQEVSNAIKKNAIERIITLLAKVRLHVGDSLLFSPVFRIRHEYTDEEIRIMKEKILQELDSTN